MPCRKHQARDRHCERSEAISDSTMAFADYHARDCHGLSGLAMTFCKVFYRANEKRKTAEFESFTLFAIVKEVLCRILDAIW